MRNSILYYPHIEIRNKEWLKSAILLWDHIYRIVPRGYTPFDDDEMKLAIDEGLVRSIFLEEADFRGISDAFFTFLDNQYINPAGLDGSEYSSIHEDKIDNHLYPLLERYSQQSSMDGFIDLPKDIVRGYMFYLSNEVARRRNLSRCTDDHYSFTVGGYFSENANFSEFLYNRDAGGFYSSLIISDLLPFRLRSIPMNQIIAAAKNSCDEKNNFRTQLDIFSDSLKNCESKDHAATIYNDYIIDLTEAKERLKRSQLSLNSDATRSMFVTGIPVALTAYGGIISGGAPAFGLTTIATSILIGAISAYHDYSKVQSISDNPFGASYLISLEKKFCSTGTYPAFDRYMEEFVND